MKHITILIQIKHVFPVLMSCLFTIAASGAVPQIGVVLPRGGQRGTDVVMMITGQRLADVQEIMFDRPGIEVIDLKATGENQITATFRISQDCMLGAYALRIRTATGISNLKTFHVGALTEVKEAEPNNISAQAQKVEIGTTINGVAGNEDLDIFQFDAIKDDHITAEIEGIRLGGFLFDPYVAILDSEGFELATCDDSALLRQDAVASVVIPEDGTYFVQVRESSYAGNGQCYYRLHLGKFPRPTATVPSGGKPGETITVKLLGEPTGEREMTVTLPPSDESSSVPGGWFRDNIIGVYIEDENGISPSPNFFRLSNLDNILETEPNNNHNNATVFIAPAGLNGVISQANDRDCFRFSAKKGEHYIITVFARQLRSPLDSVVRIHVAGARQIAANDDAIGPDSQLDFTVPADGDYVITIHDHLLKGGADFAYRIELAKPDTALSGQLPRNVERVVVPRGNRILTLVTASRAGFGGPLNIDFENLPEGVEITPVMMPGAVGRIPVVFNANAEAPLSGSLSNLSLTHADPNRNISGGYKQDIEQVLGRNRVVFQAHSVDRIPVVVSEEVPFTIEIVEPKAPLVQNGNMQLLIKATRAEGFDAPIRLRVPFVPPGVGASNSITIGKGQTEARIPVNANGNANVRNWPLVVAGDAGAGRGPVQVSSQMISLEVTQPFLSVSPQATTVEQGQETTMFFTLHRSKPFEGNVKFELRGLPNKVSSEPVELTPDTNEFEFTIKTDKTSPPGRHKNVFCVATITINDEPVVHRLPAGELRIDKPLPAKVAQAAPKPKPTPQQPKAEEVKPKPKRLTRLEKLRIESEERKRIEEEQKD